MNTYTCISFISLQIAINIIQDAQWACIAHLVFAIYIPLSIYNQRMIHAKY